MGVRSLPSDSSLQNFSIKIGGFSPITLDRNKASGSTGAFDVTFDWTYTGSDPMQNFARVAVGVPRYLYQINNTPNAGFDGLHSFAADSSASWAWFQQLRCDKGVASGDGAPAEGCIFVEACRLASSNPAPLRGRWLMRVVGNSTLDLSEERKMTEG